MTDYPLDLSAVQIVHWLRDEKAEGRPSMNIRATREYVFEPPAQRAEGRSSDEADAIEVTTVGTLEVMPLDTHGDWQLQVRVEDVVGPHLPEDEAVPDQVEEIDFDDFYEDFIAPDRGTVYVTVSADTPEGKQHFDRLFADLIRDRHAK